MPVDDPPIPMGLLKYMQPKRVAHKHSEGVLPFKVACIAAGQRELGDHVQACPGTPVSILQLECYMVFYVSQSAIQSFLLYTKIKNNWTHSTSLLADVISAQGCNNKFRPRFLIEYLSSSLSGVVVSISISNAISTSFFSNKDFIAISLYWDFYSSEGIEISIPV